MYTPRDTTLIHEAQCLANALRNKRDRIGFTHRERYDAAAERADRRLYRRIWAANGYRYNEIPQRKTP